MLPLILSLACAVTPQQAYTTASATCAGFALRSTGYIHYFCECSTGAQTGCVAGSDANASATNSLDCTTAASPCQTWEQARVTFNRMAGGDTVALCKGGAWNVTAGNDCSNQFTNAACAAGSSLTDPANASTCDLRDYGASWGGTAKPIVRAASSSMTRIINTYSGGVMGVRVLNLWFQGGSDGPRGANDYNHRGITSGMCNPSADNYWLVCNNTFDRLQIAMQPAQTGTVSNFMVRGNVFTMNRYDAILGMGNGSNNTIDANYFDNNGGYMDPNWHGTHSIYLTPLGNTGVGVATNTSVTNNEFRRSSAGSPVPGVCSTGVLVSHGFFQTVNLENNLVDGGAGADGNCWGIDFRSAGSDPTYYRTMTVRRNIVTVGGAGIIVGQAPSVVIENNLIALTGTAGWKQGILSPRDAAGPSDDVENNATIRNNTIYITGGDGSASGIVVETEGTGHVIANNAIQMNAGLCWRTPLADGAYTFVGNNSCYGVSWDATPQATTPVTANPSFVAPPTDFRLQGTSPLRDVGTATYSPLVDLNGYPRTAPPDIGAYEYGSTAGSLGSLSAPTSTVHSAPRFTLSGDTTQVILSTLLSGAKLYYCTGSAACTPARSAGTQYSVPLTVPSGQTVCARAWKGQNRYPISCSTYTVN